MVEKIVMTMLSVPKLKQVTSLDCGITALRMVLHYYGVDIPTKKIVQQVSGLKKYGVRTVKLADVARQNGFNVECYSYNPKLANGKAIIRKPNKRDIIRFLEKKVPVILAVRSFLLFNKPFSKTGHFIVVTGYEKEKFRYNDPADGKQHSIREEDLMFAWHNNVLESSAYLLVLKPKKG